MKSARPEPAFTRGPRLARPERVLEWLDRQKTRDGRPRLLRLPVAVEAVQRGRLPGGLSLRLDDSALGIGLADRVAQHCRGKLPCHLSLEGTFGRAGGDGPALKVTAVRRAISEAELATSDFAEVEGTEPTWVLGVFPLPASATLVSRDATTVAPGRNHERFVYESPAESAVLSTFYDQHLGEAVPSESGLPSWTLPAGSLRLDRGEGVTRIVIVSGPR